MDEEVSAGVSFGVVLSEQGDRRLSLARSLDDGVMRARIP